MHHHDQSPNAHMQHCLDACAACAQICDRCADDMIGMEGGGHKELRAHEKFSKVVGTPTALACVTFSSPAALGRAAACQSSLAQRSVCHVGANQEASAAN